MNQHPIIYDCLRHLESDLKNLNRERRIELRKELILELEKEQEADQYPSVREPESACSKRGDYEGLALHFGILKKAKQ